ncbi:MAG: hypothetical protein K2K15_04180 [Anaeroplasmataceae bacterium]|nr:hypothetical protein [Anaeroplasmataceae bacterium]
MKKEEKEFLEELNKHTTSKVTFNDLPNVDIDSSEKPKNKIWVNLLPAFVIAPIACILLVVFLVNYFRLNPDDSHLQKYEGFIKEEYEAGAGIGFGWDSEPMPSYTIESLFISNYFKKDYIYELQRYDVNENEYIVVYIEKNTAEKINMEYQDVVCGPPSTSELNNINGSIPYWFYSAKNYNPKLVKWYVFDNPYEIVAEVGDFICCGVYKERVMKITREIISDKQLNYEQTEYACLTFDNVGEEFIKPRHYQTYTYTTWYLGSREVDFEDENFIRDYDLHFNISINDDYIYAGTCAVSREEELQKIENQDMAQFYRLSNAFLTPEDAEKVYAAEYPNYGYYAYSYDGYVQSIRAVKTNSYCKN